MSEVSETQMETSLGPARFLCLPVALATRFRLIPSTPCASRASEGYFFASPSACFVVKLSSNCPLTVSNCCILASVAVRPSLSTYCFRLSHFCLSISATIL